MKNVITTLSIAMILLTSCSPSTEKKVKKEGSTVVKAETVSTITSPEKNTDSKEVVPADFAELVPIDVLNTKSTNTYEKYGIEFSGNCYSCDLARLSVTHNKIVLTNVCDEKDTFEINDFSFSNQGNTTALKTSERTYILKQIDKAPVYELIIEGEKLELKNKRLSKYFTTKKALPLFAEHDCGDFEG